MSRRESWRIMICALSTILSWDGLHNNIVKHESPECIKATSHPKRDSRALWDTIQQGLSQPKFLQFVHFCRGGGTFEFGREKTASSFTQPQVSLVLFLLLYPRRSLYPVEWKAGVSKDIWMALREAFPFSRHDAMEEPCVDTGVQTHQRRPNIILQWRK